MLVIDGIPLHPLVVHAVVAFLPLAALAAIVIAVRRSWRRSLGIPVALVALVGAVATPIATTTGEQLQANLPANPLLQVHADLGSMLTPYAIAFAVLVAAAVLVELSTDRVAVSAGSHAATPPAPGRSRLAGVLAALAALAGIWVTYLVVRIGHAGATVVWQGIGQ